MLNISLFLEHVNADHYAGVFLLLLILQSLITNKWARTFFTKILPSYDALQKIHEGEVSRFGGFCMLLGIILLTGLSENKEVRDLMTMVFLGFSPLAIITFFEDLHIPCNPKLRLAIMFVSCWLMLIMTGVSLPVFDTPYLVDLLASPIIGSIFFTLCIVSLINGANFVDGTNGNFALMMLAIFTSLFFLGALVDDMEFITIVLLCATPMLAFLIFNYPWGRLFAGDLGAYLYGALVGFLIIFFFGKHSNVSAWNAVLIVFYPMMELIYSVSRKILTHKSPFEADRHHIHIKVYDILYRGCNRPKLANNLVTLFLGLFWLSPTVILPWVYQSHTLLVISLAFLTVCYVTINLVVPSGG